MDLLSSVIDLVKKNAETIAAKEEHHPMLFLIKDGELTIAQLHGAPPYQMLRAVLTEEQPDAYALIVEGRAKRMHPEDATLPVKEGEIANDASLPEVLMLVAAERHGDYYVYQCCLEGSLPHRTIGPWMTLDPKRFGGRIMVTEW